MTHSVCLETWWDHENSGFTQSLRVTTLESMGVAPDETLCVRQYNGNVYVSSSGMAKSDPSSVRENDGDAGS
jgi:hypothetical protein